MEPETINYVVSAYNKIKGINIFNFKAYFEKTADVNISNMWVMLSEILVNLPLAILNLIVGIFSLIFNLFEKINIYETYRQIAYDTSKGLWKNFVYGFNGTDSLLYIILGMSAFLIFFQYLLSKGDFTKRILHLLVILTLGLAYFGSVNGTSGGVYLLDTVHNVSDGFKKIILNLNITSADGEEISTTPNLSDNYIAKTSYSAYLYVNTGRLDGKYKDSQTGELVDFDDSKVLGVVASDGSFTDVKEKDRKVYLDTDMGDGGADGDEHNRWVSAVGDLIFPKMFFVLAKIGDALVIALPLFLINFLDLLVQTIVIVLIYFFPISLLLTFIPKFRDMAFNVIKGMMSMIAFPALTGFLTLLVFFVESIIENFAFTGLSAISGDFLGDYKVIVALAISVLIKGLVFWGAWKKKADILAFFIGGRVAGTIATIIPDNFQNGKFNNSSNVGQNNSPNMSSKDTIETSKGQDNIYNTPAPVHYDRTENNHLDNEVSDNSDYQSTNDVEVSNQQQSYNETTLDQQETNYQNNEIPVNNNQQFNSDGIDYQRTDIPVAPDVEANNFQQDFTKNQDIPINRNDLTEKVNQNQKTFENDSYYQVENNISRGNDNQFYQEKMTPYPKDGTNQNNNPFVIEEKQSTDKANYQDNVTHEKHTTEFISQAHESPVIVEAKRFAEKFRERLDRKRGEK
ncbi:hypothetical protein KB575_00610 [Streptococcus canis]|uniref:hypothetical protein n=1 Tax=Streptococcus canis TaxID=1329 RepID=UPI002949E2ED|nr:hypothetical protein [Streptococcus canis]MDV5987570.1 hypothetical protein [Streptococcus canis]